MAPRRAVREARRPSFVLGIVLVHSLAGVAGCSASGAADGTGSERAFAEALDTYRQQLEQREQARQAERVKRIRQRTGRWDATAATDRCAKEIYEGPSVRVATIDKSPAGAKIARVSLSICLDSQGDVHVGSRGVLIPDPQVKEVRIHFQHIEASATSPLGPSLPIYANVDHDQEIKNLDTLTRKGGTTSSTAHNKWDKFERRHSYTLSYPYPEPVGHLESISYFLTFSPEWVPDKFRAWPGAIASVELLHVLDGSGAKAAAEPQPATRWTMLVAAAAAVQEADRQRLAARRIFAGLPTVDESNVALRGHGDRCLEALEQLGVEPIAKSKLGEVTVYVCSSPALDLLVDMQQQDRTGAFPAKQFLSVFTRIHNDPKSSKPKSADQIMQLLNARDPALAPMLSTLAKGIPPTSSDSPYVPYMNALAELERHVLSRLPDPSNPPPENKILQTIRETRDALASQTVVWPPVVVRSAEDRKQGRRLRIVVKHLGLYGEGPERSYAKDPELKVGAIEVWQPSSIVWDDPDDLTPVDLYPTRVEAGFERVLRQEFAPMPPAYDAHGARLEPDRTYAPLVLVVGRQNAHAGYFRNSRLWVFDEPEDASTPCN